MEGIYLTLGEIIIVVIAAILILIFSLNLVTSTPALSFGVNCYFSFTGFGITNSFLYPIHVLSSYVGINTPYISETAAQLQTACLQTSDISSTSNSVLSAQLYTRASSCFNLFQGSNTGTGEQVASSLGNVFDCYNGKIIDRSSAYVSNYSAIIDYIDQNYNRTNGPVRIVFITNSTDGNSTYPGLDWKVYNDSYFTIEYFGYPSNGIKGCSIPFEQQCTDVSPYGQPFLPLYECGYSNQTVSQVSYPVSSLSNGNPSTASPPNLNYGCDVYVSFCGRLINAMVYHQDRVFVCLTNNTS